MLARPQLTVFSYCIKLQKIWTQKRALQTVINVQELPECHDKTDEWHKETYAAKILKVCSVLVLVDNGLPTTDLTWAELTISHEWNTVERGSPCRHVILYICAAEQSSSWLSFEGTRVIWVLPCWKDAALFLFGSGRDLWCWVYFFVISRNSW